MAWQFGPFLTSFSFFFSFLPSLPFQRATITDQRRQVD
jgi:hypothetical protein